MKYPNASLPKTSLISPQHVLLIRNSNSTFGASQPIDCVAISDWYATTRKLDNGQSGNYFWISFDFGDGNKTLCTKLAADYYGIPNPFYGNNTWTNGTGLDNVVLDHDSSPVLCTGHSSKIAGNYIGQSFLASLAAIINLYQIDAILTLPGVPLSVQGPFSGGSGIYFGQATEIVCALAANFNVISFSGRTDGLNIRDSSRNHGTLTADGFTSAGTRTNPISRTIQNSAGLRIPAWGRVGWASRSYPTDFSNLSQVQTIVNNAIAAESTFNKNKPLVCGGTAYIYGGGIMNIRAINTYLNDLGYTFGIISGASEGNGYGYGTTEIDIIDAIGVVQYSGAEAAVTYSSGVDGIWFIASPARSLFGIISPLLSPANDSIVSTNVSWQVGAWTYCWSSSSFEAAYRALRTGASLGFCCIDEPVGIGAGFTGLGDQDSVALLILQGRTGLEACYESAERTIGGSGLNIGPQKRTTVQGDPLYAPYLATRIV